jgi:PAS domain S-box-containing protein
MEIARIDFLDRHDPLARIQDLADDAIIIVDHLQQIILFNQGAEKMFGYAAADVVSQPLDLLLPAGVAEIHRKHVEAFDGSAIPSRRMGERSKVAGRRKDGAEFPAEASIAKITVDGQSMYAVIMRDATERTLVEARLKASLREKEMLVQEIHHRVKNNLQVISSLFGLQARAIADPAMRLKFAESQSRVHSLAMLHEDLHQVENHLTRIDLHSYIPRLAAQLFRFYGVDSRIRVRTQLEHLTFPMDTAVPCGLIINELLSNSFKYAFPNQRSGEVGVELCSLPGGRARLVVYDDGMGMAGGVDWHAGNSLGLRLVQTLAEQLGATVAVQPRPGVRFAFEIPAVG